MDLIFCTCSNTIETKKRKKNLMVDAGDKNGNPRWNLFSINIIYIYFISLHLRSDAFSYYLLFWNIFELSSFVNIICNIHSSRRKLCSFNCIGDFTVKWPCIQQNKYWVLVKNLLLLYFTYLLHFIYDNAWFSFHCYFKWICYFHGSYCSRYTE